MKTVAATSLMGDYMVQLQSKQNVKESRLLSHVQPQMTYEEIQALPYATACLVLTADIFSIGLKPKKVQNVNTANLCCGILC